MRRALVGAGLAAVLAGAGLVGGPGTDDPLAVPPVRVLTHDAEIGTHPQTWSAADYDGVALTTDAPDTTDLPTVHAVYMHPADRPSVFDQYAASFQAEHRRASAFLTTAAGMAFRWDKRTSSDGRVLDDITVVKSRYKHATLAGASGFSYVGEALKQAGLTDPDKKYFVWLDVRSDRAGLCGQSQAAPDARRAADNAAQRSTYAVAYKVDNERYASNGGFCNPVLHELLHGTGAVAEHMPHYYEGGHCNDDANDVMCTIGASPGGALDPSRSRTLDGGNDDYLDPAADLADTTGATLPHWTVNLSRFWCPPSAADETQPDCGQPNEPLGPYVAPATTTKGGGRR